MRFPARDLTARHPRIGSCLYVSAGQYFLVQLWVASRFRPAYSATRNTISDLGNTACGQFNARPVCSPGHTWMNASLVALGMAMMAGSVLMYGRCTARTGLAAAGFTAFGLGGFGAVLVGLYPENTVPAFHGVGAALPFLVGNLGVLVLGCCVQVPRWLRALTVLIGAASLVALGCYTSNHFLGLGEGGIERLVAYPQTVWMIVFGAYTLAVPCQPPTPVPQRPARTAA